MAKSGGKGVNLKDKLEGNELDLSLCDLNEVPVKELAGLPKATVLDLSCNNLTSLPSDFCSLTHLVKLDLSKNQLQQLPSDFGRLINLQHLDLLNNRLVTLPISFAQLKNLKWLDLKDNPLDSTLAKVAGDCLDEKQCKQAAIKVLHYMKSIQSELDRERQRKLQAERELEKKREAEQRAREAQERELRKREKAEEKERRRREYDALKAAKQEKDQHTKKENGENPELSVSHSSKRHQSKRSWYRILLKLLLFLLLSALSTLIICKVTDLQHKSVCISVNRLYEDALTILQSHRIMRNVLQLNSQQ
ncbi:leucine-rich repeat-containing protein 59 [Sphaerodactylus townsendi]|uniref:leucine-rich repeat-containing protein 59 n=1 Tax=Sphaerodactylus townsendi TaxID=933632 RepID=UPI002026A510|nr:leucine-rich repeat-containing protein 59 [Sphaerodactylus townsendi]XP_048344402.1 leucine-rich repeat-containing protein 59 [Sphaerodactylus townsendi]XP_048344403.1 leucine-rich repeat-containing protein 59 [Sphaerodactylus townsendi]